MYRTPLILFYSVALLCCGDDAGPVVNQPPEEPLPEDVCSGYPDQSSSPYVLPWEVGQSFLVVTGNCGLPPTHRGIARYAYDIGMPIRTRVHAARGGAVIGIEERFTDGNNDPRDENRIFILHRDGTVARYYHLTRWGAAVKLGQQLAQGEVIGLSGNTGSSVGPSLHFDVVRRSCGDEYFGPSCETMPVTFRNTRPHPNGLEESEVYRAEPF
ncbi:MAG: M23 family metallopeptidase [Gemmatimonadales bacterium]|nr:M23 family metallopeptidase [Gemmatimonadales bacterium]